MERSLHGLPPITRSKGPHSCICEEIRSRVRNIKRPSGDNSGEDNALTAMCNNCLQAAEHDALNTSVILLQSYIFATIIPVVRAGRINKADSRVCA